MKIYKFLSVALLAIAFSSCSKHTVEFNATPAGDDMAEFQLHYFEAISATAVNYIDSVFVNDVLYSSVNGSGQLLPYNGVPGGGVGRFFTVKSGENNLKLYRKGNIVYDQTITLAKGKQNVFVYDMNKAPIILDNGHPYQQDRPSNPETWGTDSIAYVDFYNFLFEIGRAHV